MYVYMSCREERRLTYMWKALILSVPFFIAFHLPIENNNQSASQPASQLETFQTSRMKEPTSSKDYRTYIFRSAFSN